MKKCELCKYPARMYCESDQASLCWDCDAKVHCANFLVARHSRSLLCHSCQSPTPWKASGPKLAPTLSVCESCANNCYDRDEKAESDEESQVAENDEDDDEIDEDDDENDEDDDSEDEDEDGDGDEGDDSEDGENQVVPWSSTSPPPVASSSSSDESSSSCRKRGIIEESTTVFSLKRIRENEDLGCQDDLGYSASNTNNDRALTVTEAGSSDEDDEGTSCGSFRRLKDLKRSITTSSVQPESSATAFVGSLERFQHEGLSGKNATSTILGICKLGKDPDAADLASVDHH